MLSIMTYVRTAIIYSDLCYSDLLYISTAI